MAWFCFVIKRKQKTFFPINELPFEILLEIFYKLPAKQLHLNKIVCKLWSSLISHTSFGSQFSLRIKPPISHTFTLFLTRHHRDYCSFESKHLTNNNNNGKSLFIESKDSFKFITDNSLRAGSDELVDCLASSNGLILCSTTKYELCRCLYYVCNPMTKQWITLPSPPSCIKFVLSGFVCNPNYGTQFKVVRSFYSKLHFNVEIFDSATNQWKVFKIKFKFLIFLREDANAIEHRGILYWECRYSDSVIVFNPNNNNFDVLPLPGTFNFDINHKLGVSQNDLYYTEIDLRVGYNNNRSTIWRFDELKHTFIVHRSFDLYDYKYFDLYDRPLLDHINLKNPWGALQKVLGIDTINCNIMYLSLYLDRIDHFEYWIYSVDTRTRKMKKLSHSSSSILLKWSLMFIHPNWPTTFPKLPPPSSDDNLYNDTHPNAAACRFCQRHVVVA